MKIVNHGNTYEIYSNELKTYDLLPAATYKINFNPMSGYSLSQQDNFETLEEKIYGNHLEKIRKVLKSYDQFQRSMGVILSGDKGMGKSLFVQLLAQEAVAKDLPVIMVTHAYPGIAEFIDTIDQEALVIFDEFEKVFSKNGEGDSSQNSLLGLFDGTSQKKRMYAITVNNLYQVSEFMVSRTGRFHYHLRFDYPSSGEIEIYLKDKLNPEYHNQIKHVIAFAKRVKLNYDSLRAIAFEMNMGYPFNEAIGDLNILNTEDQEYNLAIEFSNGEIQKLKNESLDLFGESIRVTHYGNHSYFTLEFPVTSLYTDGDQMLVKGDDVDVTFRNNEDEKEELTVKTILITQAKDKDVNFKLTA